MKHILILLMVFITNCATAQTDLIFKDGLEFRISNLNDTGITWAGNYPTGNNSSCNSNIASQQDCNHGRDFTNNNDDDGHAGFSYTKLDSNGDPLDSSASNWVCVRDNVTGLVWEVKTLDDGIHNKDLSYRWGGVTHQGDFGSEFYTDWDVLVNGSNNEVFCGFDDWRVPTRHELYSIVDISRSNPTIDTDYFPNTIPFRYWTSLPMAIASNRAWQVDFEEGDSRSIQRRVFFRYVRLVR